MEANKANAIKHVCSFLNTEEMMWKSGAEDPLPPGAEKQLIQTVTAGRFLPADYRLMWAV